MEYIHCPLCESDNTRLLYKRKDLTHHVSDIAFHIVKCRKCGFVYVNPRPSEEDILDYYPEEFYAVESKEKLLEEYHDRLEAKYKLISHLPKERLLDIGCNKGEFLYYMQNKGWDGKGVEFSATPTNYFDQDIYYGKLYDAQLKDCFFDLVTLWAVLEHVYDPVTFLKEVNRVTKPGGYLVALVTNINSIPARFMRHDDIPRHTSLFSKRTLSRALKQSGFRVKKYYFNQDIFNGTTRGLLNYLVKVISGEKLSDVVEQNRSQQRWYEFVRMINGKESELMEKIDGFDMLITPYLDRLLDFLHWGFIMIVLAEKK